MINQIDLIEAAHDDILSDKQRLFAYTWLNSWPKAEYNLRHFTITELRLFIVYEVNNRRRKYVVNRLLARLSKVTRQHNWKQLQKLMEEKNAGARDRAISMSTSRGARRDSDKADFFE